MIKVVTMKPGQKPTPEQIAELEAARNRPIVFDEDCPELTEEELREFQPAYPSERAVQVAFQVPSR